MTQVNSATPALRTGFWDVETLRAPFLQPSGDHPMLTLCGFSASNYYNKVKLALFEKACPFRNSLPGWARPI